MQLAHLALATLLALVPPTFAVPALAQTAEQPAASPEAVAADLARAMRFDDLFAVLREEGLAYGTTLEAEMFPAGGGAGWAASVSRIYDVATLRARFDASIAAQFADRPDAAAEILAFFASDLGQRVVGLEIDARRAFLDTAAEEAARVAAERRAASRDPKDALIQRFIAAGDLLEMNVAGALTGNLAFQQGMAETGGFGAPRPEADMIADIWADEERVRDTTATWLQAYLGLAYDPLTEAELESYVAFMESPAGQQLNAALFVAFDSVFRDVSRQLGAAAGVAVQGSDI